MVRLPIHVKTRGDRRPRRLRHPERGRGGGHPGRQLRRDRDAVDLRHRLSGASRTGARCRWARATSSSGPRQKVYHPRSGKFLGYMTQISGTVKVNRTREPKVRAVVEKAFDDLRPRAIASGRPASGWSRPSTRCRTRWRCRTWSSSPSSNRPSRWSASTTGCWWTPAARRASRSATSSPSSARPTPSRPDVGVDPSANQDLSFPVEEVGQCMAVDVRETMTTCLILRSIRELVAGDRVEMRAGGATNCWNHSVKLPRGPG